MEIFKNLPGLPSINEWIMPIIFLLDISGSMEGDKIKALIKGVNSYIADVGSHPYAGRVCEICIITFNHGTEIYRNWAAAESIEPISVEAGGGTQMTQALRLAVKTLDEKMTMYNSAGITINKPKIILVTDGKANDDITEVASEIKARSEEFKLWVLAVPGYNKKTAAMLTEGRRIFEMAEDSDITEFFEESFLFFSILSIRGSTSAPGTNYTVDSNIGQSGSHCRVPNLDDWLNN